jgi:hypothetical protein
MHAIETNLRDLEAARLAEIESGQHRAGVLQPFVGQALFWIVAVDEVLGQAHKGKSYRAKRDDDPDGRSLDGARLARNAVAHGAVVLQGFQDGITYPITYPLTYGEVRWSPLDELLEQWHPRQEPTDHQKVSYQRSFFGVQPQEPLRAAQRWLLRAPSEGWAA